MSRILVLLFLVLSLIGSPVIAAADEIVYTYTGNPFTDFSGDPGVTTANYITVTLTLTEPLTGLAGYQWQQSCNGGPGGSECILRNNTDNPLFVSMDITDGVHAVDSATPGTGWYVELQVNELGAITSWDVSADQYFALPYANGDLGDPVTTPLLYTLGGGPGQGSEDFAGDGPGCCTADAINESDAGSWSSESLSAPEPSSLLLIGTGLVFVARRKLLA